MDFATIYLYVFLFVLIPLAPFIWPIAYWLYVRKKQKEELKAMEAEELANVQDICASELNRWLNGSILNRLQDDYSYFNYCGLDAKKYWSCSHDDWMAMTTKERQQAFAVIEWFATDPNGFFEAVLTPELIEKATNRFKRPTIS